MHRLRPSLHGRLAHAAELIEQPKRFDTVAIWRHGAESRHMKAERPEGAARRHRACQTIAPPGAATNFSIREPTRRPVNRPKQS
jgi:hypothetical protein